MFYRLRQVNLLPLLVLQVSEVCHLRHHYAKRDVQEAGKQASYHFSKGKTHKATRRKHITDDNDRFYKPERGSISFHGTDINKLSMPAYRSSISLVSQEASLFEGTIRENILLGVDELDTPESAIHLACQQAEIHDFIISLPDSYETAVGTRGVALSGGQKQRIAIARALIRNPRVLLLDEATSNLDSETEREVQGVFERTGKGRTMVVVAHRLATVQNADIIFVIEEGRVVEKGSHSVLLEQKGVYWQMVSSSRSP